MFHDVTYFLHVLKTLDQGQHVTSSKPGQFSLVDETIEKLECVIY